MSKFTRSFELTTDIIDKSSIYFNYPKKKIEVCNFLERIVKGRAMKKVLFLLMIMLCMQSVSVAQGKRRSISLSQNTDTQFERVANEMESETS